MPAVQQKEQGEADADDKQCRQRHAQRIVRQAAKQGGDGHGHQQGEDAAEGTLQQAGHQRM